MRVQYFATGSGAVGTGLLDFVMTCADGVNTVPSREACRVGEWALQRRIGEEVATPTEYPVPATPRTKDPRLAQLRATFQAKSTARLRWIWRQNDRVTWSTDAFLVMRELLLERGEVLPAQCAPGEALDEAEPADGDPTVTAAPDAEGPTLARSWASARLRGPAPYGLAVVVFVAIRLWRLIPGPASVGVDLEPSTHAEAGPTTPGSGSVWSPDGERRAALEGLRVETAALPVVSLPSGPPADVAGRAAIAVPDTTSPMRGFGLSREWLEAGLPKRATHASEVGLAIVCLEHAPSAGHTDGATIVLVGVSIPEHRVVALSERWFAAPSRAELEARPAPAGVAPPASAIGDFVDAFAGALLRGRTP